jgi:3alpha(or 20beta)-hydroxysteroid dehydrogenase
MGKLKGKVALITGAASGMGAAQARLFVHEGAKVLLCDVDTGGQKIADELGEAAAFFKLDVGEEVEWKKAVADVESRFGGLNILSNCAGIAVIKPLEDTSADEFERQFRVNQLGTFLGIRSAVAPMVRVGGGSIINISSGAGLRAAPTMACYSSTKFGVRGLTQSAASELAEKKIRVNTIYPGAIDTPLLRKNPDEFNAVLVEMTPLKRLGTVDEIANAALFLASDDASFVTGADFAVDGGGTI